MTEPSSNHACRLALLGAALPWLILLAGLCLLGFHAYGYADFVSDDAYISLRYARRLLDGHGLTFTDGERVEGYSNLLWVLACAGLGRLGLDLLTAARILGLACSSITSLAVLWLVRPRTPPETFATAVKAHLPGAFAVIVLALSQPIALWAVGGLEAPLFMVLLILIVARLATIAERTGGASDGVWVGVLLGLLALTRPDGALPASVLLGTTFLLRRRAPKPWIFVLTAGAILAMFLVAQGLFRFTYYGALVPNTAHAKIAFSMQRIRHGLAYLGDGLLLFAPVVLSAVAVLVLPRVRARQCGTLTLLAAPLGAWLVYVAVMGGDFMPGYRHLVPILPLVVSLAASLVAEGMDRGGLWAMVTVIAVLAAVQFFAMVAVTAPLRPEVWAWEGRSMGALLKTAFGRAAPLLAVDAAGSLPYYSELPTLDMLGLTDRTIATRPPADFGHGWMGHELGDASYVLDREPDLIVFNGTHGQAPMFRGGRAMVADPRFAKRYRALTFVSRAPTSATSFETVLFARVEGGRIGIDRTPNVVRIPGHLFAGLPGPAARLNSHAELVVEVDERHSAHLDGIALAQGTWRVQVLADAPALVHVTAGGDRQATPVDSDQRFQLPSQSEVNLEISPKQTPRAQVREVRLVLENPS